VVYHWLKRAGRQHYCRRWFWITKDNDMKWLTLEADDCTWDVRVVSAQGEDPDTEVLEFDPRQPIRPPRRLVIARGSLPKMSEADLKAAYLKARPIGADFYGRPGKKMPDTR
jgi:hypothetical protein